MVYFDEGVVIASSGNVVIYMYNNDLHLEIGPGHALWARGVEINEYEQQLKNIPKGACLEVGLGLGIASNYILSIPGVTSLTTIEKNRDVVECYRQLLLYNKSDGDIRHNVIIGDAHYVLPNILKLKHKYDFIFFDHYSLIDEDTIEDLSSLVQIAMGLLNNEGTIKGWFDPYTPPEFADQFYNLF